MQNQQEIVITVWKYEQCKNDLRLVIDKNVQNYWQFSAYFLIN